MKIPKSFKLFSHKIKIVVDNKQMHQRNLWGEAQLNKNKILICTTKNNKKQLKESIIRNTFYHEKVHCILQAMNERDLNTNEKFVDNFANLLLQSDLSTKY